MVPPIDILHEAADRLVTGLAPRAVDAAPRVLIATTTPWAFPARVAMAFAELGWHAEAICWFGNPLSRIGCVRRLHHYAALRPVDALARAMSQAAPDLIVPCDDRALAHLLALHERSPAHEAVIARSLGDPRQSAPARSRAGFIALAREESVRAPPMFAVDTVAELRAALRQVGLPAMLKLDNSWGGDGVAKVISVPQAEQLFERMSRGYGARFVLQRLVTNGDPFYVLPGPRTARTQVNVQGYVQGTPANCVLSCWQGEVLAIIQVNVLCAQHAMGPATIVQVTQDPEITDAARRLVGRLGLSGFCGLDFVIDAATGAPHLIEMNQRITPLGHLALSGGRDPVAALAARQSGRLGRQRSLTTTSDIVAFFPEAWHLDPSSPHFPAAHHDVPWSEPALVRVLARLPWRERSWVARFLRRRLTARVRPPIWSAPARRHIESRGLPEPTAEGVQPALKLP
jgi:carbamoylphosphate synthase large subunit